MAVVSVDIKEVEVGTGLKKQEIVNVLVNMGVPVEEEANALLLEVTPNRPDLFSVEGVVRALNLFHGKKNKVYSAKKTDLTIYVDKSVGDLRPYVVGARVKNVNMSDAVLRSLIQLQEKLHETIGRKRKKIAIGIHNADRVVFPLYYKFVENEWFVPLDFEKEVSIKEILETHPKGREYGALVGPKYPVIYDKKGVLSLPPIINSERTRVEEDTKNLVIEATGTHLPMLGKVLNIIVCALIERGGKAYQINVNGRKKESYPNLVPEKIRLDYEKMNAVLGEKFSKKQIFNYLKKMGWIVKKREVFAAPYRTDIIHYVDAVEDVAIAYGYNNFKEALPDFFVSGSVNSFYSKIRKIMVGAGYIEVVNYILSNEEEDGKGETLKILNPKTREFTLVRRSIMPSLLKNLATNKTYELPIKLFEIGKVYDKKEKTKLGFAYCAERFDFSVIQGMLQTLFLDLEKKISLEKCENPVFIKGRGADIIENGKKIGVIGEVSFEVLEKCGVVAPVGVCEIEL